MPNLNAAAPPHDRFTDRAEIRGFPPEMRYHLFTDIRIRPKTTLSTTRYGRAATGCVIVNARGHGIARTGTFEGERSNNAAELIAIARGLDFASKVVRDPGAVGVIVHTDSKFAYRAIRFNEVNKPDLIALATTARSAAECFLATGAERTPCTNAGIRAAESQARRILVEKCGGTPTYRGSKGVGRGKVKHAAWNPFEGDRSWAEK